MTGARGGVGREVMAQLRASGHRAAAVGRNAESLDEVPSDDHLAAGTTTPEGAVAAALVFSVVVRIGKANHEAIAAAKGSIEALSRSAAASDAPLGPRINAAAPGMLREDALREGAGKPDLSVADIWRPYPDSG